MIQFMEMLVWIHKYLGLNKTYGMYHVLLIQMEPLVFRWGIEETYRQMALYIGSGTKTDALELQYSSGPLEGLKIRVCHLVIRWA